MSNAPPCCRRIFGAGVSGFATKHQDLGLFALTICTVARVLPMKAAASTMSKSRMTKQCLCFTQEIASVGQLRVSVLCNSFSVAGKLLSILDFAHGNVRGAGELFDFS